MMSQRKSIPRKRERPRRKRPELFWKTPAKATWRQISLHIRTLWWRAFGPGIPCGICGKRIWDYSQLVPDHIVPGKMGGCKDHSIQNLQPAHWLCNSEKGSKRSVVQEQAEILKEMMGK